MDVDFGETPESEIPQADFVETYEDVNSEVGDDESLEYGDFGSDDSSENNKTIMIVVAVILVILCCCCLVVGGGLYWLWNNGDEFFGLAIQLAYSLI